MFCTRRSRWRRIIVSLWFCSNTLAHGSVGQTTDEAVLRAIVEQLFVAYAKEDSQGFMALWSAKSPEFASRQKMLQEFFAAHEQIEIRSVQVQKLSVEGEKANARVEMDMSAVEAKTNRPATALGKMTRSVSFVKEQGEWKVWREVAAEEDLAAALVAAKSEDKRATLRAADRSLITIGLQKALVSQGNRLSWLGNNAEALAIYQLALQVAEEINDQPGIAAATEGMGIAQYRLGNLVASMQSHQKSLKLREALRDKAGIGSSLNQIGYVHFLQGDQQSAMDYYKKSLKLREEIGNKSGMAATLLNMGIIDRAEGNYALALERFQRSLALREELGDKGRIAASLVQVGYVHYLQGNYRSALEAYNRALKLSEEVGNKPEIAFALDGIGDVLLKQASYSPGIDSYRRALALHQEQGNTAGAAYSLLSIGYGYSLQGDHRLALDYYQQAMKISETSGNREAIARALEAICAVRHRQGDYSSAMESCQRSLKLREELGDKGGIALSLSRIGFVHFLQGDFNLALDHYQRSLKLLGESGRAADAAPLLNSFGVLYSHWGNYDLALDYHQRAIKLYEASGNKVEIAKINLPIGHVHRWRGNYALALESYQKALAQFEALGEKADIALTLNNLGFLYLAMGEIPKALELAERTALLSAEIGSRATLLGTRVVAGRAYRALNQPAQARQAFEEGIAVVERLRAQVSGGEETQQRFFENNVSPYLEMVQLLIAQQDAREALTFAERAKSRVLLDVLSSGRVDVTKAMTRQEQERERNLEAELASLNSRIYHQIQRTPADQSRVAELRAQAQRLRLEYEAFQASLYAAHPELKVQRGNAQTVTLEEATRLIADERCGLLEYVVTEEKTYLFVLAKGNDGNPSLANLKTYTLPIKRKELVELVGRFRHQLATRDAGFRALASRLYDLLLKPAGAELRGKNSLVIVPDGVLWELPFQALQTSEGRYLLEDYAISCAPSLTVLREIVRAHRSEPKNERGPWSLLAFGNPALANQTQERVKRVHRDEKLDPLPEAEREVKTLAELYGGVQSKVYIGAEAREDRLKAEAGRFRVLHLATHGILNDASPMYSQIVLAQGSGDSNEDGLLEAWEIMKLDLNADLVVLSACETGRGRIGAGEGLIGLAWALFVAGTQTSVVSQWKVDSKSTTELMINFHRNLREGSQTPAMKMRKAKALREAALKLLRSNEYRHPFYWAGFVLMGDAD